MEKQDEINLLKYWRMIKRRWKIIAVIFLTSVVTVAVISLRMTPIYQARTTIMPIESSGGQVADALRDIPFLGGIGGTSANKLVVFLESRTMAENIVQDLDLINVFFKGARHKLPSLQDAVGSLAGITEIKLDKGLITIAVEYKDTRIAADIANQYTIELQRYLSENILSMAKRNRIFLENQLHRVKKQLQEAEEAIKAFQIYEKVVVLGAPIRASFDALADLKPHIRAKVVQIAYKGQFAAHSNPDMLNTKDELRVLNKQLAIPCLSEASTLGLQYTRLKRQAATHRRTYELLTRQYAMAKIEEAKEKITFQIIDRAIPPDKKIKPKIKLNIMLAGVVSLFAGIFLVFFLGYLKKLKSNESERSL